MTGTITGATQVAGVVGSPVRLSLSPLIHNAWIAAAGIDAVYVAFAPRPDGLDALVQGLRGGVARGLNVTVPFKEAALALADEASPRARRAGAANLLVFNGDGTIFGDNTDGAGLMSALAVQAPRFDPAAAPAVVMGAGGAGRGAVTALLDAGAPAVRVVNRSRARAQGLADAFGARIELFDPSQSAAAVLGAGVVVNATTLGLEGQGDLPDFMAAAAPTLVVMDMVYRPLRTALLARAQARGLRTVDGLAMLIGQAAPSFEALFGRPPPPIDVRALALAAMDAAS